MVTVPKLNEMAAPAAKVPDVKLTVSTRLVPSMLATPVAPDAGDVKASGVLAVQASPSPDKLIKSLPVGGTKVAGVRVIDMVTPVAPRITLLSEIKGLADPNEPSTIAGNVPSELRPQMGMSEPSSTTTASTISFFEF